jgi:hypothetical protein
MVSWAFYVVSHTLVAVGLVASGGAIGQRQGVLTIPWVDGRYRLDSDHSMGGPW